MKSDFYVTFKQLIQGQINKSITLISSSKLYNIETFFRIFRIFQDICLEQIKWNTIYMYM